MTIKCNGCPCLDTEGAVCKLGGPANYRTPMDRTVVAKWCPIVRLRWIVAHKDGFEVKDFTPVEVE